MLDKTYSPAEVEAKHYAAWESSGAFACDLKSRAKPYSIVIPPPNITGTLHMGHALNNTLQDILVRYRRKRGRDVLWQVGTDHAGIATQMVVERQLADEKLDRRTLGREAFLDRVWSWKEESGGAITNQLRRLGASPDWSRERFTMDEGLSRAVVKVFVELYRQGLLYRDKRLVNWDCRLHTAISDLEVEQREVEGFLWHIKYPVEDIDNTYITVATTRPETMFGDTGVAVHPDDERYRGLVGKYAILPLVGRRIPIVADEYTDPEKGSGAVKITPAHDFNDFEVGRRHDLDPLNIFDASGRLNDNAPEPYRGLDRFEARKKAVKELDEQGLLAKTERHRHVVPYGDRSGVVVEPWLTDQWFVNAESLAKPAIEAVERGALVFVPESWTKTFFEWMRNIQPWCISRQIWWGHRIPAWYGPDGTIFVAESEDQARAASAKQCGEKVALTRDPDVLDTWFSSALWPFSTLGWPERTPELQRYYPTDVLVTGFDIIFFWVARMTMMGLHFMDEVPFKTVYIHSLVRDERGRKMSKSKGNVIDPLELMDAYGTDALRFTLAAMAAPGRDIKLSEKRVEGYRNFATKLWNAARLCEMNKCLPGGGLDPPRLRQTVNRWIVTEMQRAGRGTLDSLDSFRFDDAANGIYHFTWGTFCDWYLEFIKPVLGGVDGPEKDETRATAGWVLEQILGLLHPFMPFITEELWDRLGPKGKAMLIRTPWPEFPEKPWHPDADDEINWVIRLVSEVRAVRTQFNVEPRRKIAVGFRGANATTLERLERHEKVINKLSGLKQIERDVSDISGKGTIQAVIDEATIHIFIGEFIELDKEKARLEGEVKRLQSEIDRLDEKLSNEQFTAKAPAHVVERQRERRSEAHEARKRLKEALGRLEV